jgi:hypothetical protein
MAAAGRSCGFNATSSQHARSIRRGSGVPDRDVVGVGAAGEADPLGRRGLWEESDPHPRHRAHGGDWGSIAAAGCLRARRSSNAALLLAIRIALVSYSTIRCWLFPKRARPRPRRP